MSLRGALSLPLPLRLKSALLALNNPCRAKSAYWCLVSRANKVLYVSVGFASTVLGCPLGFPATSNKILTNINAQMSLHAVGCTEVPLYFKV